jgi:plastocyanin
MLPLKRSHLAPAAGSKVSIVGFAFGRQAVTVKAGDRITWSNDDGSPHTVTFVTARRA